MKRFKDFGRCAAETLDVDKLNLPIPGFVHFAFPKCTVAHFYLVQAGKFEQERDTFVSNGSIVNIQGAQFFQGAQILDTVVVYIAVVAQAQLLDNF